MKIRFAGFGGQGVVMMGVVFGQAAMNDGKNSMQTQSYGSASRGGLTRSDVCIEEGEIHDLVYESFDVLVALSQPSHDAFRSLVAPGGHIFYDSDLVRPEEQEGVNTHGLPATDIAHSEFGRKVVANMIVMGYVSGTLGIVSSDALIDTLKQKVPPGTEDLNIRAFNEGARRGMEERGQPERGEAGG